MRPSLVTDVNFKIKPKEEVAFIKKDEEKSEQIHAAGRKKGEKRAGEKPINQDLQRAVAARHQGGHHAGQVLRLHVHRGEPGELQVQRGVRSGPRHGQPGRVDPEVPRGFYY